MVGGANAILPQTNESKSHHCLHLPSIPFWSVSANDKMQVLPCGDYGVSPVLIPPITHSRAPGRWL
uniref:Uncharacterized protein n=1 Tax=Anguilla anguilla TaxID=7936 RepID=A0A0E9Q3Y6_ANGAN